MNLQLTERRARAMGLKSDDAIIAEEALRDEYFRAEAALRDVIAKVNRNSFCIKIDAEAFDNHCHDEMPSLDHWSEQIVARNLVGTVERM